MIDQETQDWAEQNPKSFRKWRDNNSLKLFWFTISNGRQVRRIAAEGRNIEDARVNLDIPDGWDTV